jgi:hypothetical protein
MNVQIRLLLAAAFLSAGTCAGATPSINALPDHAKYFVGEVGPTYVSSVAGLETIALCATNLSLGCRSRLESRMPGFDPALPLHSLVTIFGSPRTPKANQALTDEGLVMELAIQQRADFLRLLKSFEMDFLARFQAVSLACPDKKSVVPFAGIRDTNLRRFWQLPDNEFKEAVRSINRKAAVLEREIRIQKWTAIRCSETRQFSYALLDMLGGKLDGYASNRRESISPNERFGDGGAYIWKVALYFESLVRPEAMKELEALPPGAIV